MRGCIRRRGDSWHVYFDRPRGAEGKRRKSSKGPFPTKRDAQRWLSAQLADMGKGTFVEPSRVTLREFVEEWLAALPTRGLRPNTERSYERVLRLHVLGHDLASVRLQQLTPEALGRHYATLSAAGLSARTVRGVHVLLGQALADAERFGRIARNPVRLATPPSASAARRDAERARSTWSASELRTFLDSVRDDRQFCLWLVLATTGLRRGEACGLAWRSVDFDNARLAVTQALTIVDGELVLAPPKTDRAARSVALDSGTVEALRAHRRRQAQEQLAFGPGYEETDFVFRNEDGSPVSPNAVSLRFPHLVRRAKLPPRRVHDLRHSHASLALQAGVSPKVVSERLGHSSVGFTLDTYSHTIPAMEEQAAQLVADLVLGAE